MRLSSMIFLISIVFVFERPCIDLKSIKMLSLLSLLMFLRLVICLFGVGHLRGLSSLMWMELFLYRVISMGLALLLGVVMVDLFL